MMTVKLDVSGFKKNLIEPLRRQAPFAISHAINKTLSAVRKDQIQQMDRVFDGGAVRYTKGSPRILYSSKRDLEGFLYYPANYGYMHEVIQGGTVLPKGRKLVEPSFTRGKSAVTLTKRGKNIPNKFLKNNKEKKDKFFIGIPKGRPKSDSYYGLWRRYGKGGLSKRGKPRGRIKLIISMAKTKREQKAIFHSAEYAVAEFNKRIYRQIPASFRFASRSAARSTRNLRFR